MERGVMKVSNILHGIATVSFYAADIDAAKKWYSEFLGFGPYFERPGYVEFRIGDYEHELGLIDKQYAPTNQEKGPAGAIVYWHVEDVKNTVDRLLFMGAKEHEPLRDMGSGFITASVIHPFGNILGIMHNPHYKDILVSMKKG